MKVLAIIPARGGSKGIKDKNLAPLMGIPLINHTMNYAVKHPLIDDIVVSTDSHKILSHCESNGIEVVKRPDELATDTALVIDAIKYTISFLEEKGRKYDVVLLLEPTSPLRTDELVDDAIEAVQKGYTSASTFEVIDPPPGRLWVMSDFTMVPLLDGHQPFIRRQDHAKGYKLTGQLYAFTPEFIKGSTISVISDHMCPIITKQRSVDIDEPIDLLIAEKIIEYYENT